MCHGRVVLLPTGNMNGRYLLVVGVSHGVPPTTLLTLQFCAGINCTVEDLDLISNSQENVELTNYNGATYYEIELK